MRKIKFVEVEFKNFLSFGNNWQKFKFKDGMNIIQGMTVESGKSNGAGKSSLTELVPFALFGKTIKKITKAKIVNWYNEKGCEVKLHFTVDGVSHTIRRGIKPNLLELWIDGIKSQTPAGVATFQAQIEEDIIGMDFGTFQNLIYFSPNNTISIINAGKPEKRKFLESLFDLSVYSKMGKTVNEKLTANDKKAALLEQESEGFEKHIITLQDFLDSYVAPDVRKHKIKLNGLVMQYEAMEEKTFDVDDSILKLFKDSLQSSKDTLAGWEEKNRVSLERFKLHQELIEQAGDTNDLEAKIEEIRIQIGNLEHDACLTTEDDEANVTDLTQHKELMKDELKELINEIQGVEKTKAIFESMIQNDEENIDIAQNKKRASVGVCDSCGQEVTEEVLKEQIEHQVRLYTLDKKQHKKELKGAENTLDKLKGEKEELYQKVKDESDDIKSLLADIEKTKQAKDEQQRLRQRINDLPNVEELKKKNDEYEYVLAEERENFSEQTTKIHLSEIDVEMYTKQYDDIILIDDARKENNREMSALKIQVSDLNDSILEYQKIIDKKEEDTEKKKVDIVDTQAKIDSNIKTVKSANSLTDYLNYLKVSLKDENVKRFAISTLIPYLNQQTNLYLSESGFPYVVTVDSWLDVSIRGLGVSEVSYGSLSGGETKCIDMAVQLACNDIASMMAKTSLNLMVLDEVLDTSVDSLGVQALLNIIHSRQKTNNDSVYVITHRNEIDEFTFDSVVRIMNEDKFSRIEVE